MSPLQRESILCLRTEIRLYDQPTSMAVSAAPSSVVPHPLQNIHSSFPVEKEEEGCVAILTHFGGNATCEWAGY